MSGYQQQYETQQTQSNSNDSALNQALASSNADLQTELPTNSIPSNLNSTYVGVYEDHQEHVQNMQVGLSEVQMREMQVFQDNWDRNNARYQAVAAATNMPARLIAAIHWRESSANFNTYLHQGDPLGRPAVNWPSNIPVFHDWEEAAIHALNMKDFLRQQLEIDEATTDAERIATYAEAYNGLGYHYRNQPSPYVYAGTSEYTSGKFVSDGVYRRNVVDQQLGVMSMVGSLGGLDVEQDMSPQLIDENFAWAKICNGANILRRGSYGMEVKALQSRLGALGYEIGQDGDFGNGTRRVVVAFQEEHGLEADGVVGRGTAAKIEELYQARNTNSPSAIGPTPE